MAARPAKAAAAHKAQCTKWRSVMAATAKATEQAAIRINANSFGITILTLFDDDTVPVPREPDIGSSQERSAEQPANFRRRREAPCAALEPGDGDEEVDQRERDETFPGEIQQLVQAQTGQGRPNPDE